MNDPDIEIRLTTRLDELRGDMRRAERVVNQSLGNIKGQFKEFQGQLSTVRNLIIGSGLVLLGRQAVGVMSSFEQLQIRLTGVMGSVAEGERAFAWIKDFATETPYQVDQLAASFVRLKAFGLDPTDGTLQALSDTAAKFGGDYQTLEGISLGIGQAWAKQKLQGEEILQLVERGIPVWDLLARVTGRNTTELEKLSAQGALGRDVIAALVDEMGRMNAGSSEALMQSLSGSWSNLIDNIKNGLDEVRQAGGTNGIKQLLQDINTLFEQSDGASQYAEVTARAINLVLDVVRELLRTLGDLGTIGGEIFSGLGAAATDSSNKQQQALAPLGVALETLRILFVGFGVAVRLIWHNLKFATMELISELAYHFSGFSAFWDVLVEQFNSGLDRAQIRIESFSEIAAKALKGDFAGVSESWRAATAKIEAELEASRKRIADRDAQEAQEKEVNLLARGQLQADWKQGNFNIAQDGNDRIYRRGQYDPFKPDTEDNTGNNTSNTGNTAGGTGANLSKLDLGGDKASVSGFTAELAAIKANHQLVNGLRQLSIADEIAFWQRKLSIVESGSRDAATIEGKILQLQVRERETAHKQRLALDTAAREAQQKVAEERLKTAEQTARTEVDFGLIGQGEYLQRLRDFEAQRFEIASANLQERLTLLSIEGEAHEAETVRLQGELEALREQHNRRLYEIDAKAKEESLALWNELGQSINGLWNQGLQAMMQGTLTWKNAMNAVWAEMGKFFITKAVMEPFKQWAAIQATKLAQQIGFIKTKQAVEGAAASQSLATSAGTAMGKIGNSAAAAAAGGAESQASIPYVGPILAVAAVASLLATVGALKGNIKSARAGYDIPAGINPLTQLHEQEMVLPAQHANTIRRLGEEEGGMEEAAPVAFPGKRMGNRYMMELDDLSKAIGEIYRRGMMRGM
ncbi:tape measure protein [Microbulbifer sp. 2205BS26-8]|uniref:tape measure protein n=1 Tax=Microbulbifer sp. 2205BS26-8 TaxID=3064386 RepID=UPI00273E4A96|nr:tape measure protein [Microbulbifer sp. 2205BS26-8]MDP5209992.1 tape measure protein [Microbulbifer sp. 2205BS26-8]